MQSHFNDLSSIQTQVDDVQSKANHDKRHLWKACRKEFHGYKRRILCVIVPLYLKDEKL